MRETATSARGHFGFDPISASIDPMRRISSSLVIGHLDALHQRAQMVTAAAIVAPYPFVALQANPLTVSGHPDGLNSAGR